MLSNKIECNHPSRNTSSLSYPEVVRMETGEVIHEKVYMSPRPPTKISLKHQWKRELVSEHAQRSEVRPLSRSFQSNQPILSPSRERSGRPVVKDDTRTVQDGRKTSRSHEIDVNSFHEETVSSERTGRPVVETSVIQARSSEDSKDPNVGKAHESTRRLVVDHDNLNHEQRMLNEVDMDFKIPGLPHSVVKHAQSTSVRELIQKI